MDKLKKVLNKILFPPFPANVITAGVFFTFVAIELALQDKSPLAYAAYLLSAYGLYVLIATMLVPWIKNTKQRLRKYPLIDRYFSDKQFSARVSLYSGTAFNILYALFKLITGMIYSSFWLIAIAVYYIVLSLNKFLLIKTDFRNWRKLSDVSILNEWKNYRRTGILLLLLNTTISGIIIQVVWQNKTYSYPGTIIFASAAYAFYRIILVIVQAVKGRKHRTPIFSAAKSCDLTVAVVAMFTLQTAMLSQYSNDLKYSSAANAIMGGAVVLIVLGIAVFMLIKASKNIKRLEKGQ